MLITTRLTQETGRLRSAIRGGTSAPCFFWPSRHHVESTPWLVRLSSPFILLAAFLASQPA
jgi:hypothetical protein